MTKELENKVALVTGGAKGIGLSISQDLAQKGAKVYAVGSSELSADFNFSDDDATNDKITYLQADVSNFDAVSKLVDGIKSEAGRIDILVNNAGITRDNLLLRMKESDWDDVMLVNLKSAFNTCKTVSRLMLSQRSGRIVNIGSIVGTGGNAGQSNYAASKAGLVGFTKSLAKELAGRNILVNLIAPGYVQTAMTEKMTEEQIDSFKGSIPLKRAASPEDIAGVVGFFCSDNANYITGQVLHVDGGLSI